MRPLDEQRHFEEALVRHNYFPNQKKGESELPPCFTTRQFTPEIAEILSESKDDRKDGYDQVEYSITRYNNVPRRLGIIHPKPYSHLAKTMGDNRKEIYEKIKNDSSMIKPEQHLDGRILIMNYEDISEKIVRLSNDSFGKKFRVHSDISSCFQSIYSHSIPWAVIGFDEAKKAARSDQKKEHWSGKLDCYVSMSKRNETLGLPIGPGTSSIIVELILSSVDNELKKQGFEHTRYIDDYTCHCSSHEQAQIFIRLLSSQLAKFKLNINLAKTKIIELPEPETETWVIKLSNSLPAYYIDENFSRRKFTLSEAQNYLDTAIRLNNETPDGSVLKYAIKTIMPNLSSYAIQGMLEAIINLAWHFPIILPHLEPLLSHEEVDVKNYNKKINQILIENAKNGRSDGMSWCLYYIWKFDLEVMEEAFEQVLLSEDCISLLLLHRLKKDDIRVITFAKKLLDMNDYVKDQYWLLLYQLYFEGKLNKVYNNDLIFKTLKKYKVNFIPKENIFSVGEEYCNYFNNPFSPIDAVTGEEIDETKDGFSDWYNKRQAKRKRL